MNDKVTSQAHKACVSSKFTDAAKALLSSPLPPELIVDFKGSPLLPPALRNSTSESSVNVVNGDDTRVGRFSVCRTLSDGAGESYVRRKLESEDSSYDSDYECSDSYPTLPTEQQNVDVSDRLDSSVRGLAAHPSHRSESVHEDVSRTVSDTLAAEFSEYVCVINPTVHRLNEAVEVGSDDSDSDESTIPDALMSDPSYANRVEFALKLGYTELQVRKALNKLGLHPAQNELLAELIRLASLNTPTSLINEVEPTADQTLCHRALSSSHSCDESLHRHIIIDGSNVAITHGNKETFSCRGILLCVDWFRIRGHRDITVFVPMWRKEMSKIETPITNQEILLELEKERIVVFTPSRQVGGRRFVCYDDRYIMRLAAETDGIVVSNDHYRDLVAENPEYRKIVEERILMYSFVNDRFMPPDDPLGRNGPKLEQFLRKPRSDSSSFPPCPYGKKCTYGNKCKYYHPERGNTPHKTITERLAEQAHKQLLEVKARSTASAMSVSKKASRETIMLCGKTLSLPLSKDEAKLPSLVSTKKTPLSRTKSITPSLSLLPAELLEERPVKEAGTSADEPSVGGSALDGTKSSIHKSRSVENMAAASLALRPSAHGQYDGLHSMVQAPPLPPPNTGFCLPPPIHMDPPSSQHLAAWSGLLHPRVPLSQRLSDPPCSALPPQQPPPPPPPLDNSVALDESCPNTHRKVQRQLTLNPSYDPRLYTMRNAIHSAASSLVPPYPPPPLTLHSHLTRNASAPASQIHGQPPGSATASHVLPTHMQRLNSTSDTQLNLYGGSIGLVCVTGGSQHSVGSVGSLTAGGDPFCDEWTKSPPPPMGSLPAHTHLSHPNWAACTSLPAYQKAQVTKATDLNNEARYKLFFHLAAIFPESQVRHVMAMLPDETNAQKICAAILALYPKEH